VFTEYIVGQAEGPEAPSTLALRVRGEARPGKRKGKAPSPRNVTLLVYVGTAAGDLNILTGRKDAGDGLGAFSRVRRGGWGVYGTAQGGPLSLEPPPPPPPLEIGGAL
jgi:hypothetical protein